MSKTPPSKGEVIAAREFAGHSTRQASAVVYVSQRQWQKYEAGTASMPPGLFELYRIKTGQV